MFHKTRAVVGYGLLDVVTDLGIITDKRINADLLYKLLDADILS